MASVSVVSSTDFRASLSPQQNTAQEGDDPFSLMLNAVTDVKGGVQRPEAPKIERRADAPAKQPKPDTDPERQAKRRAPEAEKPDTKQQTQSAAPAKATTSDEGGEDTDRDAEDSSANDALLMIALGEPQQQMQQPVAADADAVLPITPQPVVPTDAEAAAAMQTAPVPVAIADALAAASAEMQTAPAGPSQTKTTIQLEVSQQGSLGKSFDLSLPEVAAEAILSKAKPENAAAQFKLEVQGQMQPGTVNVATATPLQGPAHLEMLNAAINKHVQLSLGLAADDAQPADVQKPLISSNAVAPNFAMTAQVNAPVQVQAQQSVETARAVPLEQLAVEIATRAGKGERRFDIRLDPPELGRIDVRLEIDSKGNTTTKLIVERAETLDMLQRDARGLEKALQNAGLKTDAGGMQFSLQQDTQAQHGHQGHTPEVRGRSDIVRADGEIMSEVSINSASLAAQLRGGVDIRI